MYMCSHCCILCVTDVQWYLLRRMIQYIRRCWVYDTEDNLNARSRDVARRSVPTSLELTCRLCRCNCHHLAILSGICRWDIVSTHAPQSSVQDNNSRKEASDTVVVKC